MLSVITECSEQKLSKKVAAVLVKCEGPCQVWVPQLRPAWDV